LNIGGRRGILVEGYSPLATGSILDNLAIGRIAAGYSKSFAQLSIPTSGGCLVIVGRFSTTVGFWDSPRRMRNFVR
jgi:diketogulonate reductase-like aldo/keto reductase